MYGTVSAGDWTLAYAPIIDPDNIPTNGFTTFATGSGAMANAKLGQFDPTLLLNGSYLIQLTATLSSGEASSTNIGVICEKNLKVGNFSMAFNDCTIPIAGLPITCTRTYDTRAAGTSGDFGYGWRLAIADIRLQKTCNLGKFWFQQGDFTNFLGAFSMVEGKSHKITITFPDGKTYKFQGGITPSAQFASAIDGGTYTFTPIAPTLGTLTVVGSNDVLVDGAPDEQNPFVTSTMQDFHGNIFNPTTFTLVTQEGMTYVIDQFTGLKSITDLNGNTITVTPNGLISSTGKSIVFQRDGSNRITSIEDCAGNTMNYSYDGSGNLISFTDRENNTTQFTFDNTHKLLSIIDPAGNTPATNNYDDNGRLASTTDADGKTILFNHNLTGRVETVTDRNGNPTTYSYDNDGNVLSKINALGAETDYTYDLRDNQVTMKDPMGHLWTMIFDAQDNLLTETDPLGSTIQKTYDTRRHVLTITDSNGYTTINTYDVHNNLETTKDAIGNTTIYKYNYVFNPAGDPVSLTDANGKIWQYGVDNFGNRTNVTDPNGHAVQTTYDANNNMINSTTTRTTANGIETLTNSLAFDKLNRPTSTYLADGTMVGIQYNSIGKQSRTTDQSGNQTQFLYDNQGRLITTIYADQTIESATYDGEDRRLSITDRNGHATKYAYDPIGRPTVTTYADGTSTIMTYDLAGRILTSQDQRGNITTYGYDDAGRRTSIIDPLNKVTLFQYDGKGNLKKISDANDHSTVFDYDADDRQIRTTFPDGTFSQSAFDNVGRKISTTDQANQTMAYGFDSLGRLASVTDALGQITSYTYNEVDQQLTQTDANNHTTSYAYDKLGRRVARTLPAGMTETYSYDSAGNMITRQDFNGKHTNYAYDSLNRLLSKTPDTTFNAPNVTFTYNMTGQRKTMTDANGTTTYDYDSLDRLLSKSTPNGTLTYTYNEVSKIKTVRSSNTNGVSIDYSYDSLNRLSTVTDNRSNGTTSYSYDNVGNLSGYQYANGVQTNFTYDALNRLVNTGSVTGAVLSNYAYQLGAAGNRLFISEIGTRRVSYGYDAVYRLKSETVSGDSVSANNGAINYQYDAVGNRVSRTSSIASVPPSSNSYDQNDRLNTDQYDANGDTKVSGINSYEYDFEDRISSVNHGAIAIVYDGDGNRVSKNSNGVVTKYLVDTNNLTGFAQVFEELDGGNSVGRIYVYGEHLISQSQIVNAVWTQSFYGYDGQGSVRFLTDATGAVTDRYDYDAFGILLSRLGATPNNFLYIGEQADNDLGLYYLRARYMNQMTGRFLTPDTFEGMNSDPISLHKYLYAYINPINKLDRSGHDLTEYLTTTNIIAGLTVIGGIAGYAITGTVKGAIAGATAGAGLGILITVFRGKGLIKALVMALIYGVIGLAKSAVNGDTVTAQKEAFLIGVSTAIWTEVLKNTFGGLLDGVIDPNERLLKSVIAASIVEVGYAIFTGKIFSDPIGTLIAIVTNAALRYIGGALGGASFQMIASDGTNASADAIKDILSFAGARTVEVMVGWAREWNK